MNKWRTCQLEFSITPQCQRDPLTQAALSWKTSTLSFFYQIGHHLKPIHSRLLRNESLLDRCLVSYSSFWLSCSPFASTCEMAFLGFCEVVYWFTEQYKEHVLVASGSGGRKEGVHKRSSAVFLSPSSKTLAWLFWIFNNSFKVTFSRSCYQKFFLEVAKKWSQGHRTRTLMRSLKIPFYKCQIPLCHLFKPPTFPL